MQELGRCCEDARNDPAVGVIILTGMPCFKQAQLWWFPKLVPG